MNLTTINFLLSKIDCVLTLVRGPHYATNPYYGKCWEPASGRNDGRAPVLVLTDHLCGGHYSKEHGTLEHWMLHCTAAKDPYTKSLWVNFDIFKFIVRRGFSGSVAELKINH